MSILIKGMKLPRSCSTCRFSYFTVGIRKRCEISSNEVNPLIDCRETNCPLKEVPTPHGRLIDADALLRVIEENSYRLRGVTNSTENGMFLTGIRQAIDESPTIIEAEVRE